MNSFSCLCVTAGRVKQLETAVANFLDQKCAWPRELLIVNTLPEQELAMDGAELFNVRIVNLSQRPDSLGSARNFSIRNANGTHLVQWDDDDEYAPWYLNSYIEGFKAGASWVWLDKQFYAESGKIRKIARGMFNTFSCTKSAAVSAGGYLTLSVGEDRNFVGRVTYKTAGMKTELSREGIGYIYNWKNSVYHISGLGDDKPGKMTAWERSGLELQRRVKSGQIPSGRIILTPKAKESPESKIRKFFDSSTYKNSLPQSNAVRECPIRLYHAVERHEERKDDRKLHARASWDAMYELGVHACHYWKYDRDATQIGDARKLPFLKDVLKFALEQARDEDIVFLTNDDTVIHPELPELLLSHVAQFGPCCSQRCEFRGVMPRLTDKPKRIASLGRAHMGRDLFAAKKEWWLQYWEQLGDPILGASDWDLHLACVFRLHHGITSTRKNLETNIHPAELPRGYVLHRFHSPKWAEKQNVSTAASQVWNRNIFKAWAGEHMQSLIFHRDNRI